MSRRLSLASHAAWLIILCAASASAQTEPGGGGEQRPSGHRQLREGFCTSTTRPDFTGEYTGLLRLDNAGGRRERVDLIVRGNEFEIKSINSGTFNGKGIISVVNSCGYIAIALKFTEAEGNQELIGQLLSASASLTPRRPDDNKLVRNLLSLQTSEALVLSTAKTLSGKPAGAQIVFQKCPDPPCSNEDYPECPRCVQ